MLCDNILPNLNISRLVPGRSYTDVKSTYNTKMIQIMVSFSDYQNSIVLDRVLYKHKNIAPTRTPLTLPHLKFSVKFVTERTFIVTIQHFHG